MTVKNEDYYWPFVKIEYGECFKLLTLFSQEEFLSEILLLMVRIQSEEAGSLML